jgi:hypothetical protein
MKKGIYLIMFIAVLGGCKQQLNFVKVTNNIYMNQIQAFGDTMLLKGLQAYREKSNILERLRYSPANDTVFALEMLGFQGDLYLTYWNRVDTISYTNTEDKPGYVSNLLFTKYMMGLVSQWNILKIKEEEKVNSSLIPKEPVYATRIIIRKNTYKVECVRFNDFFNLERDCHY